jgi:non-heme chloroperoxidase
MTNDRKTFTTSDGAHLAYTDEGEGQAIVLVHGMLCHRGHWKLQRDALLGAGYRLIALDLRFHGESDRAVGGHRISRLGQDLGELIAEENLNEVVLVGHSMGVSVTLAYLSLHGTRSVAAIVAIDQAPRIINDETWQWGVRHVTWSTLEGQITGQISWSEFDREPPAPPHVQQLLHDVGGVEDFYASPLGLRFDHFTADWRDVVPAINVSLWVATGQHSPSFPLEGMRWIAETAPRGRLTVYPDSGHCPHWNEPDAFNHDLLRFLEATTRTGRLRHTRRNTPDVGSTENA